MPKRFYAFEEMKHPSLKKTIVTVHAFDDEECRDRWAAVTPARDPLSAARKSRCVASEQQAGYAMRLGGFMAVVRHYDTSKDGTTLKTRMNTIGK